MSNQSIPEKSESNVIGPMSLEMLRVKQQRMDILNYRLCSTSFDGSVPAGLLAAIAQFHDAKDALNDLLIKHDIRPIK